MVIKYKPIKRYDGSDYLVEDVQDGKLAGVKALTMKDALITAASFQDKDERPSAAQAVETFKLVDKIWGSVNEVELSIDEVKKIVDNLPLVYNLELAGRLISILESGG